MAIVLAVTERLAREVAQPAGAAQATVTIWSLGRWPLVVFLVVFATAGLYKLAPGKRRAGVRAVSVSSVAAVLAWLLSSVGFEFWLANLPTTTRPTERSRARSPSPSGSGSRTSPFCSA